MKISSIIKCYQGKNIESNKNITGTHAFRRESYAHIYIHTHTSLQNMRFVLPFSTCSNSDSKKVFTNELHDRQCYLFNVFQSHLFLGVRQIGFKYHGIHPNYLPPLEYLARYCQLAMTFQTHNQARLPNRIWITETTHDEKSPTLGIAFHLLFGGKLAVIL